MSLRDDMPMPQSLEAEAAVLSAMLLEPDCIDEVLALLEMRHFYSDANRRIFEAVQWAVESKTPVDAVTIAQRLKDSGRLEQVGGSPYLAQILNETPSVANVGSHARIVRDKWKLRELIHRCNEYSLKAYTEVYPDAAIEGAERDIAELAQDQIANDSVPVHYAMQEALAALDHARRNPGHSTGLATGFSRLDRQCTGWHDGDLYILAARPGMGKSSLALEFGLSVARRGSPAVFFSLEMPRQQLAMRLLASEAGVELSDLRSGSIAAEDWPKVTEAAAKIASLPLWIDDTPGLTLSQLRAKLKRIDASEQRDGRRVRLVAVDYMQLMRGNRSNGNNREQEVSELSRGLKSLAKEMRIPVIALSQLNRSVETRSAKDKRPQLSDLRESGAIEQDADTIMFIYRDEYYNKDTEAKGLAEIIVAKQRNGPTGTVLTKFVSAYTRFEELVAEEWSPGQGDEDYSRFA